MIADPAPEALALIGTHCPHCPALLESLAGLVKEGELSRLEVINLEQRPDIARELGVRSVPWVRIGSFELPGLRSREELTRWARAAASSTAIRDYIETMLAEGEVERVLTMIADAPDLMEQVIGLLDDPDAKINVRLGIGVIMEEYEGEPLLQQQVPLLGELTRHPDPRVRADACHYLALSGAGGARQFIDPLLQDESPDVCEVAQESLQTLPDSH
ncbi:MAG: thioredoxin family protein [Sedimenticola sp.]|nr:thioredoxin family protein [Sedimenticola sp.]